jgi:hypothetical protein
MVRVWRVRFVGAKVEIFPDPDRFGVPKLGPFSGKPEMISVHSII